MEQTVGERSVPVSGTVAPRFPALDSLRGLAAVAVLTTHVGFWSGAYAQSYWGPAFARLDAGVAVFFVLSGFLLSRPYWESARRGTPAPRPAPYLYKRALRIIPVYVVAVVAAMLLLPGNHGAGVGAWVRTLLLANVYTDERLPDGLTQMWSLSTEVAFYVALPLLMALVLRQRRDRVLRTRRIAALAGSLLAVNLVWTLALVPHLDDVRGLPGTWLPGYLTWFGVGLLLAAVQVRCQDAPTSRRDPAHALRELGRYPGVCWTAALALFAIASTPVAGPYSLDAATLGEATVKNLLYAGVAGLLILPAVFADQDGLFQTALRFPALRHVGHVSYGVFCLHLVVLETVTRWRDMDLFGGRHAELFVLTLVGSLLAAEVVHRLVEKPVTGLRRLGPHERRGVPAPPRA